MNYSYFFVCRVVLVHLRGVSQHAVQREMHSMDGERIDQILVPVQQRESG